MIQNQQDSISQLNALLIDTSLINHTHQITNHKLHLFPLITSIQKSNGIDPNQSIMFCYPAKVNQRTHTNPIYTREFGKPTCIGSSNDILAVGSNKGNILLFMMNPDLEFPHKKGKDDTESNVESIEMKYKKYGEVCSLDIREDNLCLVAAFENGSIIIYDIMKMTVIENIPLHTTKILKVKFLFYPQVNFIKIVSSDQAGNTKLVTLKKGLLSYNTQIQILENRDSEDSIICIDYLPLELQNKYLNNIIQPKQENNLVDQEFVKLSFNEHTYVLFLSLHNFSMQRIYKEKQNPDQILSVKNQSNQQTRLCALSFGQGVVQGKQSLIILFSWDNALYLIISGEQVWNIENQGQKFGVKCFPIQNNDQFLYHGFLNQSIVFIVTNKQFFYMLHTQNIESNKQSFDEMSKVQINHQPLNIIAQTFGNDHSKQYSVSNCFTTTFLEQELLFLGVENIGVVKQNHWIDQLNHFVDDGEWHQAMELLISIKTKKHQFLNLIEQDLPLFKEKVVNLGFKYFEKIQIRIKETNKEFCNIINIKYDHKDIELVQKYKDNRSTILNMITILIEFYLYVDENTLVFNHIIGGLNILGVDPIFLECFEPFIEAGLIKSVPEDALQKLIFSLKKIGKLGLIEALLIGLDVSNLDVGHLQMICLENNLIEALINLAMKYQEDFLTPISRIWAIAIEGKRKQNFEKVINTADIGYKYLDAIININLDQIGQWIIENLDDLIEFDPIQGCKLVEILLLKQNTTFDGISLIFQKKNRTHITENQSNCGKLVDLLYDAFTKLKDKTNGLAQQLQIKYKIKLNVFDSAFHSTLLKIFAYTKLHIENQFILQSMLYVIKNPQSVLLLSSAQLYQSIAHLDSSTKSLILKSNNSEQVLSFLESQFLVICFLKYQVKEKQNENIKAIIIESGSSPFLYLYICASECSQSFEKIFDLYLSAQNPLVKDQIFAFIWKRMEMIEKQTKEFENDPEFIQKKDHMGANLAQLIQINSEKTRELVSRFHKEGEANIVKKLNEFPKLQLEYLEKIISKDRMNNKQISNDLLKLHIELLAKQRPEDIIDQIQQFDYPLDEILEICKKEKQLHATVFLLERTGAIQDALDMHVQILKKEFNSQKEIVNLKIKSLEQKQLIELSTSDIITQFNGEIVIKQRDKIYTLANEYQQIQKIMENIVNFCQRNSGDNHEQLWYVLLDELRLFQEKSSFLKDELASKFITQTLNLFIAQVFTSMFSFVPIPTFIESIKSKYISIQTGRMQKTYLHLLCNHQYQANILNNSKMLIQNNFMRESTNLLKYSASSMSIVQICGECNRLLNNEGSSIYSCGHSFHNNCSKNCIFCSICIKSDKYIVDMLGQQNKKKLKGTEKEEEKQEKKIDNVKMNEMELLKLKIKGYDRKKCETWKVILEV